MGGTLNILSRFKVRSKKYICAGRQDDITDKYMICIMYIIIMYIYIY